MPALATTPRDRAALAFAAHLRGLLDGCSRHVRMAVRSILESDEPCATAPVRAFLDVSTGHVTDDDRALIEGGAPELVVYQRDTGWMIHAGSDRAEFERDRAPTLRQAGYSEDLVNLLRTAIESGCDYVLLDADAEPYDGLPTHDW